MYIYYYIHKPNGLERSPNTEMLKVIQLADVRLLRSFIEGVYVHYRYMLVVYEKCVSNLLYDMKLDGRLSLRSTLF